MTLYYYQTQSKHLDLLIKELSQQLDTSRLKRYQDRTKNADVLVLSTSKKGIAKAILQGNYAIKEPLVKSYSIGFLFSGQGCQYPEMIKPWMTIPSFKKNIDDLIHKTKDENLSQLLNSSDESLIHQTAYTQPALFAFQWAMSQIWKDLGIEADITLGHSVGEYPAHAYAGGFTPEDGFGLITQRAKAMTSLPPGGGMLAIKSSYDGIKPLIKQYTNLSIAAINAEDQVVVSGDLSALEKLSTYLKTNKVRNQRLTVSHGFHSYLLDPILKTIDEEAKKIKTSPLNKTLISNLTGNKVSEPLLADYWSRHAREPVQFLSCLKHFKNTDIVIEVGPRPILSALAQRSTPGVYLASCKRNNPIEALFKSIYQLYSIGVDINWIKQTNFNPIWRN
ncbi:MAG TPA: acyltransferase domain-containing protein [Gammaproteobacteria bacterium]|nr:acyltransferase domain-containing protein [Gammaproteobacteria bacterium]